MNLETLKLFDKHDTQVGQVQMPQRTETQEPRRLVWKNRKFVEGDGSGFYGFGEMAEVDEWPINR